MGHQRSRLDRPTICGRSHHGELGDRGIFPRNPDFRKPTPYFVDADGTRCAVAHLIEASGELELVQAVATRRNNATVHALADEPGLAD